MDLQESQISVYAFNNMVAIETPGGTCFVDAQVAIEITVSLTRAALTVNPDLDAKAIRGAFKPTYESVQ